MSLATDLLSIQVSALAGDLESPTNVAYRLGFVGGIARAITMANELGVGSGEDWKARHDVVRDALDSTDAILHDHTKTNRWLQSRIAELEALLGDLVPDAAADDQEEVLEEDAV